MKVRKAKRWLRVRPFTLSFDFKVNEGSWQKVVETFKRMSIPSYVVITTGVHSLHQRIDVGRAQGSTIRYDARSEEERRMVFITNSMLEMHSGT